MALPRFSMTESYADLDRFDLVSTALPLTVTDIEPPAPYQDRMIESIGFTIADDLAGQTDNLSCFISGKDEVEIQLLGPRVEVRASTPLTAERFRLNCTLPAADNRWRWFGMLYVQPTQNVNQEPPALP